jgi:hypothetical protein
MAKKKKTIEDLINDAEQGDVDFSLFNMQEDLQLKEMNDKHAFIDFVGGKSMVMCRVYNAVYNKEMIEFVSVDTIKQQYCNRSIELVGKDGVKFVEQGVWWLKNSGRRTYKTIVFDPSQPKEHMGCLNMWEGFKVEPKKGTWKRAKKHIWNILCNKDPVIFKYVMKWFVWCVQNPHERAEVALIFKGKQGAGKGLILTQFVELFGAHGTQIAQRDHLTGKFSGHLKKIVFLYADEAYYPGDKEVEGNLKNLITESVVTRESKFMDPVLDKNRLHIVMSTNNEWVIPASQDSRRFFINKIDDRYAKGSATDASRKRYFTPIWIEMNNGGREAMLYDLLKYDLKGWHPRDNVPETKELLQQQYMSMTRADRCILNLLENGFFPGEYVGMDRWAVPSRTLLDYINELDEDAKKISEKSKILILQSLGVHRTRNAKTRMLEFPSLKEVREKWNENHPPGDWDISEQWQVSKTSY